MQVIVFFIGVVLYVTAAGHLHGQYRVAPKGGLARGGTRLQHECTRVSCAVFLA